MIKAAARTSSVRVRTYAATFGGERSGHSRNSAVIHKNCCRVWGVSTSKQRLRHQAPPTYSTRV